MTQALATTNQSLSGYGSSSYGGSYTGGVCCVCIGTCCHTGPHMYCREHGPKSERQHLVAEGLDIKIYINDEGIKEVNKKLEELLECLRNRKDDKPKELKE